MLPDPGGLIRLGTYFLLAPDCPGRLESGGIFREP
jgi:hypothetical protein